MKDINNTNTEEKILAAAEEEFIEKGKAGARMQRIADKAGINKSLLHYYYRTKDKLFEMIFYSAFKAVIPKINKALSSDIAIEDKIKIFTNEYISLIMKRPNIPVFIINELHTGSTFFVNTLNRFDIDLSVFEKQIKKEIKEGKIRPISVQQLILNIVSLCVFPIIAKPVATSILFKDTDFEYDSMLEKRKTEVADFIINSIKLR